MTTSGTYRAHPGAPLAETEIRVEPGDERWVRWETALTGDLWAAGKRGSVRYLRLDVERQPEVEWIRAGRVLPGCIAAFAQTSGRLRRLGDSITLAHRLHPAQRAYGAEQVTTGVTRPHASTNAWHSDPAASLPQALTLRWDRTQRVGRAHLTFDGHLLREYDRYPARFTDSKTIRDYRIEVRDPSTGSWVAVVEEAGNFQTRRVHRFAAKAADAVRVVVTATNGDPSAIVYEVRCYED